MIEMLSYVLFVVYLIATVALTVYALHLYMLSFACLRRSRTVSAAQERTIALYTADRTDRDWPIVTTQIPLYNERDVARRIMEATAAMDYPAGRHEIQVLDDSTDETRRIVDRTAAALAGKGHDVAVIRRDNRDGYKAGALAEGLRQCRGKYVAVFDADFVPRREFLRQAVALIDSDEQIGCVQGRWTHINERESWLTRAQALGIDGHFGVEQPARGWNGLLLNFNGTAGMWRKAAIDDPAVGGWSGDTLTEDLDLSYRAQLAGWRIEYCRDLDCPAEVPSTMKAFKSQQRRWATGSIQTARKLLPRILFRSPHLTIGQRCEATLHLTQYFVAVWMVVLALTARPIMGLFASGNAPQWAWLGALWAVVMISAAAPSATYIFARYSLGGGFSGLLILPVLIVVGLGLCLNNALAVCKGFVAKGGEFVRTPKSGSSEITSRASSYRPLDDNVWVIEIVLGIYLLATFGYCAEHFHWAYGVFLLFYAIGFLMVGWQSRPVSMREPLQPNQYKPDRPKQAALSDAVEPAASVG